MPTRKKPLANDLKLHRRVNTLFNFLSNLYGPDKLVLKAGKLNALKLMSSDGLEERLVALQRLVFEDPTLVAPASQAEIPDILEMVEEEIADMVAMKTVEESLDQKIAHKMQERHREYLRELRREALKEEDGPENSTTLKRLADLESLEGKGLNNSALAVIRPKDFSEVIGQAQAIHSLIAKLGTPYPQHVILYGPPGVGKTTVARLVLEEVRRYASTPFAEEAPFIEVDATTIRWDPREITNPLLGSVHDPIYQGSRRDLAEDGIPEPKLGLVTKAHGGGAFYRRNWRARPHFAKQTTQSPGRQESPLRVLLFRRGRPARSRLHPSSFGLSSDPRARSVRPMIHPLASSGGPSARTPSGPVCCI